MYLELNLNELGDSPRNFASFPRQKSQLEVFKVIEKAANDNNIRGIVLNISAVSANIGGSRDYLWELRTALEQFKSKGKKICAFIGNADMDVYALASVADKIVMDELGILTMLGYSVNRGYVKNTLEKLGIGVREMRYFEYKSAGEIFTRDSMSEADRRQYNEYLDDIFNLTRYTLKTSRNWTEEDLDAIVNNGFLFSAKNAKERGLVDFTGRKNAVLEALKEMEGRDIEKFALWGDVTSSLLSDRETYSPPRVRRGLFRRSPIIAVVYANGQTDMQRGIAALSLAKTVRELADNRRVKAIVLRIDSPGGSALAADYFAEAVRYAKQRKPVVVSMGQMAASGGYWIAMDANHITATPYTITGSIGVIGNWFYDNGFNARLGLNTDTLQRGTSADLFSGVLFPNRNLTVLEEERYKTYVIDLYDTFVRKAAAGRGMDIEKIEAVAQGRIFSGIRALEAGLIDSIGGLSDALRTARTLAGIPESQKVRYNEYPKPKFFDRFLKRFPVLAAIFRSDAARQTDTFTLLADLLLPNADIRYRIANNGKIMAILPLEFSVR
jgi:protease-4